MSESIYSRPYFLANSTIHSAVEYQGAVTEAYFLDGCLPHIQEKVPNFAADQYIIKQYLDLDVPIFSKEDVAVFERDKNGPQLSTHEVNHLTLVDKYLIIKRRQTELKRYLGPVLASMIVESYFFIAPSDTGLHLYEIQKKLPPFIPLLQASRPLVEKMAPATRAQLQQSARAFIAILQKILVEQDDPYFTVFIPDLSRSNIALVLETGQIKLFDTNFNFRDSALDPQGPRANHGRTKIQNSIYALEALCQD